MNKFRSYRRFIFSVLGGLSLLATLGTSTPVMAAQVTSDIAVKISASRSTVGPGQTVTYTVTMTNNGPDDATFVDVGFQLSNDLVLVSIECDLGISPDTPFCEYSSLKSGSTVVSKLVARPSQGGLRRPRVVTTTASVFFESVDTLDPNMGNDTTSVKTKLVGRSSHP